MRRRAPAQAIGLTALDLVCGLFAMLVVLYGMSSPRDGTGGNAEAMPRLVRLEIVNGRALDAGLEVTIGSDVFRSWPACTSAGTVRWTRCAGGLVEGFVKSTSPIDNVAFMLRELAPEDAMKVRVETPDKRAVCSLELEHGYRANIADPTCTDTPSL